MRIKLEQIFNHWTLLTINILIIVAVETTGTFFTRTGLIHLLAVIFVGLGLLRLWVHPDVHDRFLKPFINRGILALLILAASHILEYISFRYLRLPRQTIYANIINFYLASLLLVTSGIEVFLKNYREAFAKGSNTSKIIIFATTSGVMSFLVLIVFLAMSPKVIQLNPSSWQMYTYVLITVLVATLGIWRLTFLKKHVSIMVEFVNYFIAAFILISTGAILSALEEVIVAQGTPSIQITFAHHFLFYGSLSLIFLAYQQLIHLGGSYEELEKHSEK